jgi:hypothetical protein
VIQIQFIFDQPNSKKKCLFAYFTLFQIEFTSKSDKYSIVYSQQSHQTLRLLRFLSLVLIEVDLSEPLQSFDIRCGCKQLSYTNKALKQYDSKLYIVPCCSSRIVLLWVSASALLESVVHAWTLKWSTRGDHEKWTFVKQVLMVHAQGLADVHAWTWPRSTRRPRTKWAHGLHVDLMWKH